MNHINVQADTMRSVYIEMFFNEQKLSSGTAFFGTYKNNLFLFTNRHNVTGRNNITSECLSKHGGIPNLMKVEFKLVRNGNISYGYQTLNVPLYKDEGMLNPAWVEHPNKKIDVVGIIFNGQNIEDKVLPYKLVENWRSIKVTDLINVIGYPFGLSVDKSPIWATGYVASEPDLDFVNTPSFLIDCRTRPGQSGSPVIYNIKIGQHEEYKGKIFMAKKSQVHLVGVYSGRINDQSDLGIVWKPQVMQEIIGEGEIPLTIKFEKNWIK